MCCAMLCGAVQCGQDTALAAAEARHSSASKIFRPVKVQHTPRHAMVVLVSPGASASHHLTLLNSDHPPDLVLGRHGDRSP